METKKIGNRVANVIYHCTSCDNSCLTVEAFDKHDCKDYQP